MPSKARVPLQVTNVDKRTVVANQVRLADNHLTRLKGLIGTPIAQFQDGHGLLLKPCRGVHSMFMSYPIDAIYLDRDSRIVHIQPSMAPWRFAPVKRNAATILEVPAQAAAKARCEIGDHLEVSPVR